MCGLVAVMLMFCWCSTRCPISYVCRRHTTCVAQAIGCGCVVWAVSVGGGGSPVCNKHVITESNFLHSPLRRSWEYYSRCLRWHARKQGFVGSYFVFGRRQLDKLLYVYSHEPLTGNLRECMHVSRCSIFQVARRFMLKGGAIIALSRQSKIRLH